MCARDCHPLPSATPNSSFCVGQGLTRKNREPLDTFFGWPELSKYPGIFELGSEGDKRLCEARAEVEAGEENGRYKTEFESPLVEFGLVSAHLDNLETMAVSADILFSVAWTKTLDFRSILQIDWRLRWCRCVFRHAKLTPLVG